MTDRIVQTVAGPADSDDWSSALESLLKRRDPFSAVDITEPRLIWDTSVHEDYDDTCNFFLLRFRQAPADILLFLEKQLIGQGIASHYIYVLFGHFDTLIRVWATQAKISQFRRILRQLSQTDVILEAREFQAEAYRLILRGRPEYRLGAAKAEDLVQKHVADINRVAQASAEGLSLQEEPCRSCLQRLIDDGLVHVALSSRSEAFRFAIILQPVPGEAMGVNLDTIAEWIGRFNGNAAGPGEKTIRAAVYKGIGYGEFLINGILERYEGLLKFNEYLREKIGESGARIRTETYLNATRKSIEVDRIDPLQFDLQSADLRLAKFLADGGDDNAFRQRLRALDSDTRSHVRHVYAANEAALIRSEFSEYFRDFLAARVLNDQRHLATALTALLEMEGLLTAAWVQAWQLQKAFHRVKEAAKAVKLETVDPTRPTLAYILDVSSKMSQSGDDFLAHYLGPNWRDAYTDQSARDLRNDIAHGRLFVDPDYLQKNWNRIAEGIGSLGGLYNSLKQLKNRLKEGDAS